MALVSVVIVLFQTSGYEVLFTVLYITCVVACDAGIIDSADFEENAGSSELLAVLCGKVGHHRGKCRCSMEVSYHIDLLLV